MKAISPTQIPDSGQSFGNHKNNCLMCDTNQQHFDVALAARQPLKSLDQPICVLITYIFFNNSTVRRKDQQKICIPSMFIAIILACFSVAVLDTHRQVPERRRHVQSCHYVSSSTMCTVLVIRFVIIIVLYQSKALEIFEPPSFARRFTNSKNNTHFVKFAVFDIVNEF